MTVEGIRVCSLDDIIQSKRAASRVKDRETLPRLEAFRDWLRKRGSAPKGATRGWTREELYSRGRAD